MKKLLIAIWIIVAVMVATSIQSSAQNKIIYGCVSRVTGILRIVGGPTQCLRLETPISWNQVGPQGPTGPPGTLVFANTAVVAKGGGDYHDPVTAMNDIANWCGTPSATNPCLLKIMPGIYDLGSNSLQMQSYVDIEGCGENTTKITGNRDDSASGVVNGDGNSEIRFLTVENRGGGNNAIAYYSAFSGTRLTNATFTASGGLNNYGVYSLGFAGDNFLTNVTVRVSGDTAIGIYEDNSSSPGFHNVTVTASGVTTAVGIKSIFRCTPKLEDVAITVSGGSTFGYYESQSQSEMANVTITASGSNPVGVHSSENGFTTRMMNVVINSHGHIGIENYDGVVTMANVKIDGNISGAVSDFIMDNVNVSGVITAYHSNTWIAHSTIEGTITATSGGLLRVGNSKVGHVASDPGLAICAGVFDGNYTFYSSTCP